MAATGNEVPLLSQLLRLKDNLVSLINQRLVAPTEQGTNGQILVWQMPGSVNKETIWMDPAVAIPPATQSSNGLMTSADKTKIDGLQNQIDETKRLKPVDTIPASADLDDYTEAGSYSCSAEASATVINKPVAVKGAFLLYVYEGAGGGLTHEVVASDGRTWSRPVPGEWQEVLQGETDAAMLSKLGVGELLWEGEFVSGSITVPGINDYVVLLAKITGSYNIGQFAMLYVSEVLSTGMRSVTGGYNCLGNSGQVGTLGYSLNVDPETDKLTMPYSYAGYLYFAEGSSKNWQSISKIYGLIKRAGDVS